MTRQILFEGKYPHADVDQIDARLRGCSTGREFRHIANATSLYWELEPGTFHLAPFLRKAIPASGPISWLEWPRNIFDKDPQDASLVQIMPDQLHDVVETGPKLTPELPCRTCRRPKTILVADPVLKVRFPSPILVNGLFYPDKSSIRVISTELLQLLEKHGLTRGAETARVEVVGPRDQDYFVIYSRHQLKSAAPYGGVVAGDPCPECGLASPRHAFYETFHRPEEEVDWYCTNMNGPGWPVVTHRVYQFLRNEGAPYVGKPLRGRELQGNRMGWYPDDKDRAFLPERFHGISDEPVEPIRPDELERLMSPAVPLPQKPKRTRARKKRG